MAYSGTALAVEIEMRADGLAAVIGRAAVNLIAESPVVADGEEIGRLAGVHLNLATNQLVDLVVRGPGERHALHIIVPVLSVDDVVDGEVRLNISVESCRALYARAGGFRRGDKTSAEQTIRQVESRELDFGATVACLNRPVGTLRRILYDEYSNAIEELVIAVAGLDHEVAVPMEWAREVHRERLVLSCSAEELTSMPEAPEDR